MNKLFHWITDYIIYVVNTNNSLCADQYNKTIRPCEKSKERYYISLLQSMLYDQIFDEIAEVNQCNLSKDLTLDAYSKHKTFEWLKICKVCTASNITLPAVWIQFLTSLQTGPAVSSHNIRVQGNIKAFKTVLWQRCLHLVLGAVMWMNIMQNRSRICA